MAMWFSIVMNSVIQCKLTLEQPITFQVAQQLIFVDETLPLAWLRNCCDESMDQTVTQFSDIGLT